jgi:subtilisin family serine protease
MFSKPSRAALAWVAAAMLGGSAVLPAQPIPGRYVAVLKHETADVDSTAKKLAAQHGLEADHVYTKAIKGFAFAGSAASAQALARRAEVAYVEQDQVYTTCQQTVPTGIRRCGAAAVPGLIGNGTRVNADVAIIDTGLDGKHPDLNVVPQGIHFSQPRSRLMTDTNWQDDNGHGTHVGGTVGALDNGIGVVGVAPGVRLWPVKVLEANGSGALSAVLAGIDWVVQRATNFEVANLSLGGGFSQAANDAVKAGTQAGIVFVVAAGNSSADAANYSPGSEPTALTVSALDDNDGLPGSLGGLTQQYEPDDTLARFSNYGEIVDVCAPGVAILSTYPTNFGDHTGYTIMSGTSMASPHVAGAAALYIARHGLTKTAAGVEAVCAAIRNSGWKSGHYAYFFDWLYYDNMLDTVQEPLLNVAALCYWTNPASLTITTPGDATKVSGLVPVQVTTTAPGVTAVQFYQDGQAIGADTDGSDGWSLNWNTTGQSDGVHTLVAVATDGTSQLAGAALLVGITNRTPIGPSARIVQPAYKYYPGMVVEATNVITVLATAEDMSGIAEVNFSYGPQNLGAGQGLGGCWGLVWDTTSSPDGTNLLRAVATANDQSQGASLDIPVKVVNKALHICSLGWSNYNTAGGQWVALVRAKVHDAKMVPMPGATMYATWTTDPPSPPRAVTAVADYKGNCYFTNVLAKKYDVSTVTFDNIVPPPDYPDRGLYYYDGALNHYDDGTRFGTSKSLLRYWTY